MEVLSRTKSNRFGQFKVQSDLKTDAVTKQNKITVLTKFLT